MRTQLFHLIGATVLLSSCFSAFGQTNMAFHAPLKKVAIFRDGYGYYVREGKVKLENGWATTTFIPQAIEGTVYVYSLDPNDTIDSVITTDNNTLPFKNVAELRKQLGDKTGLDLKVTLTSGQVFEGSLNRLLDDMLLLQVGSAYDAIPYANVKEVSLVGYPLKIKVNTSDPNKVVSIGVAYLEDGVKWDPSYVLNLHGNTGTLSLRAAVKNTTQALNGVKVQFVVGSPFVADRGIKDVMAGMPPAVKVPTGKKLHGDADLDAPLPTPGADAPQAMMTGPEEAGELYYYTKDDVTLGVGDVEMTTLLDAPISVMPKFVWNADGDEVDYVLKIKNPSKQPLTTGPVFVIDNNKPLGQDTLKYTAAGGTAELKLSRGIGVHVEKSEVEVKRGGPVKIGNDSFIPVTLKGTLTITNDRSDAATLTISKTEQGKVSNMSDGGMVKQTQLLNGEPNPINTLEWNVKVGAGKTMVITYDVVTYMSADHAGGPPVPATPTDQP